MPTNLFNFGPVLDHVAKTTDVLAANDRTELQLVSMALQEIGGLQDAHRQIELALDEIKKKVDMIFSALFGIPVTVGIDVSGYVTRPQATPDKLGP